MNEDRIVRGSEAERLLGSELVAEVLNELDSEYVEKWRRASNVDEREDAHRLVIGLMELRSRLRSIAITGQEARKRRDKTEGS